MTDMTIEREERARGWRYVIRRPEGEAELTVSRRGEGVVSADHTGVPGALEGKGVGTALIARLYEDAQAEGFRVIPSCPFVAVKARRKPDWAALTVGA